MKEKLKRGTWGIRFLINLSTVALGILIFWLLGFIMKDIVSIEGPDYARVEEKYVNRDLTQKEELFEKEIAELGRKISDTQKQQNLVADSSRNLQQTINQLLELQKLSIQKNITLSPTEQENLSTSIGQFLENQKNYQQMNKGIEELAGKKLLLDKEQQQLQQQIDKQKKTAVKEYDKLYQTHRLKLAFYQMAILVPLLIIAGYLLIRKRSSIYFSIFLAFGGATLLKVGLVMHEYFPKRYFKYVLIIVLLAVVLRILIYFIGTIAFPKIDRLMKQYREAYERFLCPICEYPIRTGPRKFLYWTRRTVHKVLPYMDVADKEEIYTCPSCGTMLFEECKSCQKIRHSLLVYCEHCGKSKDI